MSTNNKHYCTLVFECFLHIFTGCYMTFRCNAFIMWLLKGYSMYFSHGQAVCFVKLVSETMIKSPFVVFLSDLMVIVTRLWNIQTLTNPAWYLGTFTRSLLAWAMSMRSEKACIFNICWSVYIADWGPRLQGPLFTLSCLSLPQWLALTCSPHWRTALWSDLCICYHNVQQ